LPSLPYIYAADHAALPYGAKKEAELATRIPILLGRLAERYHPQLAVIACNTASTIALEHIRHALDIPVVGTVPAIKPAAQLSKTGVIGLLGTQATIRQKYVDVLERQFAQDKILLRHAGGELVDAAERKLRGLSVDPDIYKRAIDGLRLQQHGEDLDVVILACTHFPIVADELAKAAGPAVQFVHGATGIARQIKRLLSHPEDIRHGHRPSGKEPDKAENSDNIFVSNGDELNDKTKAYLRSEFEFSEFQKL